MKKFRRLPSKNLLIALAALVIVIAVVYFVFSKPHTGTIIPSTNPAQSASKAAGNTNTQSAPGGQSQPPQSANDTKVPATTPASGGALITPYGDFISNHHPGGGVPMSEASVCNTSPGATCYIQFTKGSETKKLTVQTTGGNGATYWYWNVADAGLGQGSWTVTAVASLNGQTKTANDSQPLVVQ